LLGVNSVTKGLEGGLIECCLIAEESSPQILVKHIATQAKHARVPVLVMPELKSLTKNSLGVSTLALGFKVNLKMIFF
jgi:ribosomal protein L7Ae-like RNA K-turn-binding protein